MSDSIERLASALSDRYTIDRELGRGGMATVYLADDLKHHRKVAIKVLRPELAATLGSERFHREIEIAAKLNHPHILPLLDSGSTEEQPSPPDRPSAFLFYVMPYIEGETLRDRLNTEHQLPLEESVQLTREVADALNYAHSEGVIHRDIKPENIMLSRGHAVVADFGIARAVSVAGGEQLTETGMALGTPAYMSPEQAMAEEVDGRSDIYSLGCVLYEMLGGDPPYTGSTPKAVLARKLTDPVPSLRALRTVVSGELEAVIGKALVREPVDRYKTAAEFAAALTDPSSVTTPVDTSPVEKGVAARGRKMVGVAAGVAIALLVVLGGLWLALGGGDPALDRERVAVLPLENHTGDESLDDVGRIAADFVTQGLSQSDLLKVVPTASVLQLGGIVAATGTDLDPEARLLAWARETGAGTFVHGHYSRNADSLTIQVQISEAEDGTVLVSLEPIAASVTDPMAGIARLRQRLLSALSGIFDAAFMGTSPDALAASHVPNYDAYRAFMAGQLIYARGEWEQSLEFFTAAVEADSSFVIALCLGAFANINVGRHAAADSLIQIAARDRDRLPPLDRHFLDYMQGLLAGNHSRTLPAARKLAELAPNSGSHFMAGLEATVSNRSHEALDLMSTMDPNRGFLTVWNGYWTVLSRAYHMLGDYRRELESARSGIEQFPDDPAVRSLEIRALIALDRVDEAIARLNDVLTLPPERGYATDATKQLLSAALALRTHGHLRAASNLMARVLTTLEDRSAEEKATWDHRYATASANYIAERWDEATRGFYALAEESTEHRDVQGYLGALAARRGDTSEAARVSDWLRDLEKPYMFGLNTYWRARIAALLGERENAIRLLQSALSEGLRFSNAYDMFVNGPYLTIHTEMDFEPLHDYEPFRELMRPKG